MTSFTNRAKPGNTDTAHTAITTEVKVEVWKSDGGQCVHVGVEENLHFDHIVPYSKEGSPLRELNVEYSMMKIRITVSGTMTERRCIARC